MIRRFENKVAVVTGGANGIGEGLVRRLVSEGAKVEVKEIVATCEIIIVFICEVFTYLGRLTEWESEQS